MNLEADVLVGDFRIEQRIGAGGMGVVYRARQISLNRVVALKVLGSALQSEAGIARFRREAQAVAKLKPADIFLAVHRFDDSVYFRRIEPEEFAILSALRKGKPLDRAIETALRKTSIPLEERPAAVQSWFQNWAALGWFCKPDKRAAVS